MKNKWLNNFKNFWLENNIELVLNLFSKNLEYFETPYFKIIDKNNLKKEWSIIKEHKDKKINFEIFLENENKIVVKFEYFYKKDGKDGKYLGIYLIKFDKIGKCNYFYQVGM